MNASEAFTRIMEKIEELRRLVLERTDEVLDIEGVQELTNLSKSAIYQKTSARDGQPPELPHFKRGKRLYFKRSEIEAWLTSNRVKNRAAIDAEARKYLEQRR